MIFHKLIIIIYIYLEEIKEIPEKYEKTTTCENDDSISQIILEDSIY